MIFGSHLNPFFALALLIGLLFVVWIITSIPIYIASRIVVPGKATLGKAMVCSALGTFVFFLLSFIFGYILPLLGAVVGFLGVLAVVAMIYRVGAMKTLGIAIVAFVIYIIASIVFALMGIAFFSII